MNFLRRVPLISVSTSKKSYFSFPAIVTIHIATCMDKESTLADVFLIVFGQRSNNLNCTGMWETRIWYTFLG